jgi:hypothetical protein
MEADTESQMPKNENWIEQSFDELRARGAGCSESFSDDLEKSIVREWKRPASQNRRAVWTVAIAILTIGITGGAYAGGNLIREWMYGPFIKEADGTIRSLDGAHVVETKFNEDGSAVTTITAEESMIVLDSSDLPEGTFSLSFEPLEQNDEQATKTPKNDNRK